MPIRESLRDWWRGYSDADMRSVVAKINDPRRHGPGEIIRLTCAEACVLMRSPISTEDLPKFVLVPDDDARLGRMRQ